MICFPLHALFVPLHAVGFLGFGQLRRPDMLAAGNVRQRAKRFAIVIKHDGVGRSATVAHVYIEVARSAVYEPFSSS